MSNGDTGFQEHILYITISLPLGFLVVSDGRESTCNAGDPDLIPGSGRCPGKGNGYPLQYSCLKNSMERGLWWLQSMGLHRVSSAFFIVQLSYPYMTTGKNIALTRWTFVDKAMSLLFNMVSQFSSVQSLSRVQLFATP